MVGNTENGIRWTYLMVYVSSVGQKVRLSDKHEGSVGKVMKERWMCKTVPEGNGR